MKRVSLLSAFGLVVLCVGMGLALVTCSKDSSPSESQPAPLATISFADSNVALTVSSGGAAVTRRITGGTPPYVLTDAPSAAVASAQLRTDTLTLTPVGPGSTSLTITDAAPGPGERTARVLNMNVVVTGGTGGLSAYPPAVTVTVEHMTPTQVSGGTPPYTIHTASDPAVASCTLNGNVVVVTGNGLGTTSVTIRDAASNPGLVNIPITVNQGGGAIQITVGSGTTPAYSWEGAGVQTLTVINTVSGDIIWNIACVGVNCIPSPVTHGTVPAGCLEVIRLEPVLTAGVQYQVVVSRSGAEVGDRLFTP